MAPTLEEVAQQARTLSDGEKSVLIEDLLGQLPADPRIEQLWQDEVAKRVREHKEGRAKMYSFEEVLAELEAR